MAEEIRGLNIKFDADFTEFKKNMKSAEKDIGSTQKQLKTLKESLKLKWDPEKFKQAQSQAQQAIDATDKKVTLLRERLKEMEAAGVTDKTRDEYNWLTEELNKTELSAQKLRDQLKDLDEIKLNSVTAGIDKIGSSLDTAADKTKKLSAFSAATTAGLTALGLKTVKEADKIATLATTYNMTTDAIQRFNYVALQTDTSSEALYKGFVKVQGGVADLKTGIDSVTTKALKELGLSFDKFQGSEDQFYGIIEALSKMEDQAKMVSLANDIFGERMATNLFPLIYSGTDAIQQYKNEFSELGALSEEQVLELAEFDNVMNKLKTQYANTALTLGSGLLPVMETFAEILSEDILPLVKDAAEWFGKLSDGEQRALLSMLLFTSVLSPAIRLMSGTSKSISSLIKWFKNMDKATALSYAKWALLAVAIGSVFSVLFNWERMNPVQKIIGLLGSLAAAALAAAVAFGAFHSAWSVGLAVAGIVAGIAAATAAVRSAADEIGADVKLPQTTGSSSYDFPTRDAIPEYSSGSGGDSYTESTYVDNSNVIINIEKNEYMSEEDIIQAVNKGLKKARQSRI